MKAYLCPADGWVDNIALQFAEVRVTGALGVLLRLRLSGQRRVAVATLEREFLQIGVLSRRLRFVGQLMGLQQHSLVGNLEHGLGVAVLRVRVVPKIKSKKNNSVLCNAFSNNTLQSCAYHLLQIQRIVVDAIVQQK